MRLSFLVALVLAPATAAAASPLADLVAAEATASSVLAGKRDRYAAWRAFDGRRDTAWCEGVKGDGVGASITLRLGKAAQLSHINIAYGFRKSAKLFKANNVPTAIEVSVDGGAWKTAAFPEVVDDTGDAKFAVNGKARELSLRIAGTRVGKVDDTCISEIVLMRNTGSDVKPIHLLFGIDQRAIDQLPQDLRQIDEAVSACDTSRLTARIRYPIKMTIERASRRFNSAKQLAAACRRKQPMPRVVAAWDDLQPLDEARPGFVAVDVVGEMPSSVWKLGWDRDVWRLAEVVDGD